MKRRNKITIASYKYVIGRREIWLLTIEINVIECVLRSTVIQCAYCVTHWRFKYPS